MMTEHMYDVGFEFLDDGNVNIEQSNGCEGSTYVTLHPVQVRLLAERMGLLVPSLQVPQPLVTEAHKRRLRALYDRIAEFHDCEYFFNELFERCESAAEMWKDIRAMFEMADELVADLELEQTPSVDATPSMDARNEKSAVIPVTPSEEPKRGRPVTGEAMSNAERQKAFRERQASEQAALGLEAKQWLP